MISKFFILCAIFCFFTPSAMGQFKKQTNVRPDRDCGYNGYLEKAIQCNWTADVCGSDEEAFENYQRVCERINQFRQDKREGRVYHSHNATVSCYGCMSSEAKASIRSGFKPEGTPRSLTVWSSSSTQQPGFAFNLPVPTSSVDYTGKMTAVKNQKSCGSCWAFATVGLLEYAYKNLKGLNVILSVSFWKCFNLDIIVLYFPLCRRNVLYLVPALVDVKVATQVLDWITF